MLDLLIFFPYLPILQQSNCVNRIEIGNEIKTFVGQGLIVSYFIRNCLILLSKQAIITKNRLNQSEVQISVVSLG